MLYILLQFSAALKPFTSFEATSCTRGSYFTYQLDNHYRETLAYAEVSSPHFLSVSNRSISKIPISFLHSNFQIDIKDLAQSETYTILLVDNGLLFFDISDMWSPMLVQHYSDHSLSKFAHMSVGNLIVLSSRFEYAIFTMDGVYPSLVTQVALQAEITSILTTADLIIIANNQSLSVYKLDDAELGSIQLLDALNVTQLLINSLNVTDMHIINDDLYILDTSLGLTKLTLDPLKVDKHFNIYGSKFSYFSQVLTVDGRLELDLSSGLIKTYNISISCDFLGIDINFIYCGADDKLSYVSRLLFTVTNHTYKSIRGILVNSAVLIIAFRDTVDLNKVGLGPISIIGTAPDKVSSYKVEFTVWGISGASDTQSFSLKVEYSIPDAIAFFFTILLSLVLVITTIYFLIRWYRKRKEEAQPIIVAHPLPIVSPGRTERNVVSERVLIESES